MATLGRNEVGKATMGTDENDLLTNLRIQSDGSSFSIGPSEVVAVLVATQDLTGSYVLFGGEILTVGFNRVGVYVTADCNSSQDVDLKFVGLHTSGGDEFEVDGISIKRLWTGAGTDFKRYYEIDCGTLAYLRIYAKAGTVGSVAAFLTGDTGAQSIFGTWAAVSDASFRITVDGVAYNIDAIDFTGDLSMADVAATIQAALRAATGALETVVWDTDHFIITSTIVTALSEVSVTATSTGTVGTDISGAGASDWMDSDTGNGVATAVTFAGDLTLEIDKKWRN